LTEEHRLRVFENRALRKIFGPKGDEEAGEWIRLHNEELYDLFSLRNIVRVSDGVGRTRSKYGAEERYIQDHDVEN